MYLRRSNTAVWVSDDKPYFRNWLERQAYRYHIARPDGGSKAGTKA